MKKPLWENDLIQFARLVAEIDYEGGYTSTLLRRLEDSMDLEKDEIFEIVDRAKSVFEQSKRKLK